MQMNESIENYLERILMLYERKGYARSIDIAEELGVTKPSVSHATKIMRENGYISMDASNYITLTERGREIAEKMYERHRAIDRMADQLGCRRKNGFCRRMQD